MSAFIDSCTSFLYTNILVYLLFAVGIYFTIRLGVPQFTMLRESVRVLKEKPSDKKGISSMQTLLLTTGAKVGTGNIVGVSSALCMGGPGALFWLWIMALLGGATTFIESTLAQIYKRKSGDKDGNCYGGPAFYMQKGLHLRPLGLVFSVFLFLTYAVGFNSVCAYNLIDSLSYYAGGRDELFATAIPYIVAIAICIIVFIAVMGGGRRLVKVNGFLAPIMSFIFLIAALIVIIVNIGSLPEVFAMVFKDALNFKAIFGGFTGSCLMYGLKRSLFSNEAGVGSSPNAAAATDSSHPAKQGLVQMLATFIDTLVICTATAFMCLFSGVLPSPEIAGVAYVQQAAASVFGQFGYILVTLSIALFAFTSMIGNLSYCSSAWKFVFDGPIPKAFEIGYKVFGIVVIFVGSIVAADLVWNIADFLMAMMCIMNLPTIVILGGKACRCLQDYKAQKKEGKDPVFKAASIGMNDTECW